MSWQSLGTVTARADQWQFSLPDSEHSAFRLRSVVGNRLEVELRQVNKLLPMEFLDRYRLILGADWTVIELIKPQTFTDRRLALRLLYTAVAPADRAVEIEFSDVALSPPGAITATLPVPNEVLQSTVQANTSSVVLIGPNPDRLGATVWNMGSSTLFIELGNVATFTEFSVMLKPSGYYELPYHWKGLIAGIWESGGGYALVREFI